MSFWRLWRRKNLKRNGHFSGDSSLLLGMTFGFCPQKRCHSERNAVEWRISQEMSLLWDLSHTFEMTNMSFWKALLWRISRQARVQSPPLRIGRWRFLTLDHRSRFGMTLLSFWMQRERNEESQTNYRRFLIFIRNDKRTKRREIPRIRSEWHDCHSDDHREEESPTKKVRAKWKTSWIEALRVRCFAVAQHDRVFWGFLAYARNDKKEGRTNAPLSYIKQSSDYSTMSFCV